MAVKKSPSETAMEVRSLASDDEVDRGCDYNITCRSVVSRGLPIPIFIALLIIRR